ncbi:MAG TPA: radical SAM protein [Pyrinomonadaceae bacterium]|nr:radical SAM protein [Pyrinomonadaceae bacterium]
MKVVLVDNLVMPEEGSLDFLDVHPHLGLLALAAVAEPHGHTVRIVDPKRLIKSGQLSYDATLYERAAQGLLNQQPEVVGFTALGCSFLFALNVAALLKAREPELPILLGGPHATMLHRQILERFPQFDIIVRYEADEIFPSVLENIDSRNLSDIPGLSWRGTCETDLHFNLGSPKVENLDSLPFTNYDHYPVASLDLDLLRIEAGRGCPFLCTFCSTATFFQRSFRLKSAQRLVTELDQLHERFGFSDFKLDHDLFTVNKRKILEFCEVVKDRQYCWRASARVDCVDDELLTRMAEAGCVGLYFGIETGSARLQQIARKRLDLSLVEPTLRKCRDLGIDTTASFITGYHEEEQQDLADTLDMFGRCFSPTCLPQLHMLAPEPGTPMFDQLADKLDYDGYAGPYNAFLVGAGDEALVLAHADIFSTYHYYPAALPRFEYKFAVEAADALRLVGPIILKYLLRVYEGRLSDLIFAIREWAGRSGGADLPDARMIEDFIGETFGKQHHLTSLFRFALCSNKTRPTSAARVNVLAPFDPDRLYQVGPHVQILSDLHDCERLLQRIKQDSEGRQLLTESETGERTSYLMSVTEETATGYVIDEGLEAMLSLFNEPRSCSEVTDLVRKVSGVSEIDGQYFAPLVSAGILVAHESSPSF